MRIEEVKKLIEKYTEKYRNQNMKDFDISPVYDLFPTDIIDDSILKWPMEFYHNGRFGVYLILDEFYEVIYIGKANNIGRRLSSYFKYTSRTDKTCYIKDSGWNKIPRFIVTVAVDSETWFECLSLEEYLIWNAQPIDNKRSKNF